VLNGNAIESEATRKSRIQDGVRCNGRDNANRQDFYSFFKVVMYGEETLKYIACLLKKSTKVCSFTFYIFYAHKSINCRNLIYVHILKYQS
jgi:hypothetical protein